MNPHLTQLQPYPFERLRALLAGLTPPAELKPIALQIGEPKHATPTVVTEALSGSLAGLAAYPSTLGSAELRGACAHWLLRRYGVSANPDSEILPVNGSREALFAFTQSLIDPSRDSERPVVISPNPFYQIYEGAALLAGAEPYYVNCLAEQRFQPDWAAVPEAVWQRTQLVFVCSPGNPTGAVMSLEDWQALFALSDQYGFIIASDECYSEIYTGAAPLGGLEAAVKLGRGFERLVMFTSLSKRSNVPGLRSGFVAGDAALLKQFLLYRTYHGCAMNPVVQAASAAAWHDEAHVVDNRRQYAEKFAAVMPILAPVLEFAAPDASFYLWVKVPGGDDQAYARRAFVEANVTVLPGSFLARDAHGVNPGAGFVRLALVAPLADCVEAAKRLAALR
ncbi:succinyldiaminopimelate transaminase [Neisseriaceae bacterium JH1-16]|nr:succinyldiaminopimelate transaminase [Neisseriaceae bacterium JH1-16]